MPWVAPSKHKALSSQNDQRAAARQCCHGKDQNNSGDKQSRAENEATCLFCVSSRSAVPLNCGLRQHFGQPSQSWRMKELRGDNLNQERLDTPGLQTWCTMHEIKSWRHLCTIWENLIWVDFSRKKTLKWKVEISVTTQHTSLRSFTATSPGLTYR